MNLIQSFTHSWVFHQHCSLAKINVHDIKISIITLIPEISFIVFKGIQDSSGWSRPAWPARPSWTTRSSAGAVRISAPVGVRVRTRVGSSFVRTWSVRWWRQSSTAAWSARPRSARWWWTSSARARRSSARTMASTSARVRSSSQRARPVRWWTQTTATAGRATSWAWRSASGAGGGPTSGARWGSTAATGSWTFAWTSWMLLWMLPWTSMTRGFPYPHDNPLTGLLDHSSHDLRLCFTDWLLHLADRLLNYNLLLRHCANRLCLNSADRCLDLDDLLLDPACWLDPS